MRYTSRTSWDRIRGCTAVAATFVALAAGAAVAQSTPSFEPQQKVEAREGDTWSAATVIKKEGRRYQIRYDDGTEEWATADRLRLPGTAGTPAAGESPTAKPAEDNPTIGGTPGDKPAAAPKPPAKPAVRAFVAGQAVQAKWGGMWRDAKVFRRNNDWYYVQYDGRSGEWVEHWRVRKKGENYEIGYARPGEGDLAKAPKGPAGPPPAEQGGGGKKEAATRENVPTAEKDAIEPGRRSAKRVVATLTPAWRYAPPPAPADAPPSPLTEAPLGIDAVDGDDMEKPPQLLVAGGFAGVVRSCDFFDRQWTRLEIVDLKEGKSVWAGELPPKTGVLAIAPDGKHALTRSTGDRGGERVDLWKLGGTPDAPAQQAIAFLPYAGTKAFWKDVEWAAVTDANTVLTANRGGLLSCWGVGPGAVNLKWELDAEGTRSPALSPDGKVVAVDTEAGVLLIRVADGSVAASIDTQASGSLSFSGDGRRLVAVANGSVQGFDLTSGKPTPRFGLPAGMRGGSGAALPGGLVCLDGAVIDLATGDPVAQYAIDGPWQAVGGQVLGLAGDGAKRAAKALCAWTLPQPGVAAKKSAGRVDLGPGARVALDVQLEDPEQQKKAVDALTELLSACGVTIAPDAEVKIGSRVETGKTESRTYETMGGPPWARDRETVNVTSKITRLYIEKAGQRVWEVSTTNAAGFMLNRKAGQSMQDAANDASRANSQLVTGTPLPDAIAVADAKSVPQFRLVPGGVKPATPAAK